MAATLGNNMYVVFWALYLMEKNSLFFKESTFFVDVFMHFLKIFVLHQPQPSILSQGVTAHVSSRYDAFYLQKPDALKQTKITFCYYVDTCHVYITNLILNLLHRCVAPGCY